MLLLQTWLVQDQVVLNQIIMVCYHQGSCGPISEKEGSSTTSVIGDSTRNIVQIGNGTGATTIDQEGISLQEKSYKRMSNGEVHIGENSLITKENNGTRTLC